MNNPIQIFFSYAHKDEELMDAVTAAYRIRSTGGHHKVAR